MYHVFGRSVPSFVSVSLWPFVPSSAGLINHTHTGAAAWIYRRSAGVEKGKLTVGESQSFLKDQRARRFEVEDTPVHLGLDGFMWSTRP